MTRTDQAAALAARGQAGAGLALLEAGAGDEPDAAFLLAFWHLVGAHVPRDLPTARSWLRKAAAGGHDDAAMIEVSLTANGSGALPDWAGACRLLAQVAGRRHQPAQEQLRLLAAMDLADDGTPRAAPVGRVLCRRPLVTHFPLFLTPAECAHLATCVSDLITPSVVLEPASGRPMPHPVRTSSGAVISPTREDLVVRSINLRIAAASGTAVEQGEPMQVLHYAPGQQYRPHHDAIAHTDNQRGWTMLLYLNQGYRGGATSFTEIDLTFAGAAGDALLFRNVDEDGRMEPLARHAGLAVEAGVKWLCTRWIRVGPHDPWTARANH